jgi:hypothetical protein
MWAYLETDDPPDAALTVVIPSSQYVVKVLMNPWTCMASSRVGTRITARVLWYSSEVSPTAYHQRPFRYSNGKRQTSFASKTF